MSLFTGKLGQGKSGQLVPGRWLQSVSSSDFVRGLESHFEYNGLTLNDRSQPDVYHIKKISGMFDADIRDTREVRSTAHGEVSYQSYYSGRTIVLNGEIKCGNLSKLRNMIGDLQDAFSIFSVVPLYIKFDNEYDVFINCKKLAPIELEESFSSDNIKKEFMITVRADDYRFYTDNEITALISEPKTINSGREYNIEYDRDYPLISQNMTSVEVSNGGNCGTNPTLRVYGPALDPVISNYTNGQNIVLNYNIQSGDYLEVNTLSKDVYDSNSNLKIGALDQSSDNFFIEPGENIIGFGEFNNNSTSFLEIKYKYAWL